MQEREGSIGCAFVSAAVLPNGPILSKLKLRALWGEQDVKLFELGNLQAVDVEAAAAATLPEAEASKFVKVVEEYEAESLASRPITLNMLLNVFEQNHDLPRERVQLYRRGLLSLRSKKQTSCVAKIVRLVASTLGQN